MEYPSLIGSLIKACQTYKDNEALYYSGETLSYQELDEKSSHLAYCIKTYYEDLTGEKLHEGTVIGFYLNRSFDLIIAIYAILKLGCIYAPINIDYPRERIKRIFEHSGMTLCITEISLRSKLDSYIRKIEPSVLLIEVDDRLFLNSLESKTFHVPELSTDKLPLYLMYTSGTTGIPKGVLVGQQGVMNLISYEKKLFNLMPGCRVLNFANASFDASVWEIFSTLSSGATLCIVPEERIIPGEVLANTLNEDFITHVTLPPSALLATSAKNIKTVKCIVSAGEACTMAIVDKWQSNKIQFFNAYGPTEATVCASISECYRSDSHVNIGKPIDNVQILILDDNLVPVPEGTVGEICIAGANLALGYYKDGQLTKNSFVYYEPAPNHLIYKSGDLARLNHGVLEYVGRKDEQIKLRGFRIEPGHLEFLLTTYENISQAKVVVKSYFGNDTLVAYYQLINKENKINDPEIKSYLNQHLPYYMVPSIILEIDTFPVDVNGKIDKLKLIEKEIKIEITHDESDLFKDGLTNIWKSLLGIKMIASTDNFFDIGGHSLLVAQVILMMKDTLQTDITVAEFINAETFDDLLLLIKAKNSGQNKRKDSVDSKILPACNHDPDALYQTFPLTSIQQAYYLGRSGYFELSNMSTNIYREFIFDKLDIDKIERSLNYLIERHGMLRASIQSAEKQQIYASIPFYNVKTYKLFDVDLDEANKHLKKIRTEMSTRILPADKPPICDVRISLINNKFHLHCVLDALILDGWSFYIFFREWEKIYNGILDELPKLQLSFRDYVIAEKEVIQTEQYAKDKAYWYNKIESMPLGPELPLNMHPQEIKNQASKSLRAVINKETWQRLIILSNKLGITKTTLLLGLYAEILNHWSSTEKFVINMTVFNRLPVHPQVNYIIGDFTSLELFQVDFSHLREMPFSERLKDIEASLHVDLDHRFYGGIEILRDKAKLLNRGFSSALMPVVFTCFLENGDKKDDGSKMFSFENLVFGSTQSSQVWLDYKAYEEGGKLIIEWDYIYELFPLGLVDEMHAAYCQLINDLAENEDLWAKKEFSLTPSYFKKEKLVSKNENTYESFLFPHDVVIENSQKNPNHPAIIFKDEIVSYKRLVAKSQCIADKLITFGVKRNNIVALFCERGIHQVSAMLGVFMAGGAYLPIDISLPSERVNEILFDASPKIILTTSKFEGFFNRLSYVEQLKDRGALIQLVDKIEEEIIFREKILSPKEKQLSNDLAYVIYTSGSSGKPKGVMIEYDGMMNTLVDINARYMIGTDDKLLAVSNYSFDLSVYDIFGMLVSGGTVVLLEEEKAKEPLHWVSLMQQHAVTIWNSVPMLMQMLVTYLSTAADTSALNKLRVALLSGDWIPLSLPDELRMLHPESNNLKLVSLGGATECSIWSVLYDIHDVLPYWKSIPYGRGMNDQNIYVLNNNFDICPQWVVGYLYISGRGLARGYWNDPEKTKRHFFFHPQSGERLYYTGDLGRYIENGSIEFLGRNDFQVKISGHRIELGEIENVLSKHPLINNAIVDVYELGEEKKLTAYLTTHIKSEKELLSGLSKFSTMDDVIQFKMKLNNIDIHEEKQKDCFVASKLIDFNELCQRVRSVHRFKSGKFSLNAVEELLKRNTNINNNNTLSIEKALSYLSAIFNEDEKNFKYLYPSAGGLYPVQVYLKSTVLNPTMAKGYYYFNPTAKKLHYISPVENDDSNDIQLYFIVKLSAIEPIYGNYSYRLCALETGHMMACCYLPLTEAARVNTFCNMQTNKDALLEKLHLSKDNYNPIFSYDILSGNNKVEDCSIDICFDRITLLIYVKPDDIRGKSESSGCSGWYQYRLDKSIFIKLDMNIDVAVTDFVGDYQFTYLSGQFVIFILSDSDNNLDMNYLFAGYLAQFMQMNASVHKVGLCPVGDVSTSINKEVQQYFREKQVIYCYIGGNSMGNNENTFIPDDKFRVDEYFLKKYLSNLLPDYMIPRDFFVIDEMPLTVNGKIDRDKLKKIGHVRRLGKPPEQTCPRDEFEKAIFTHWQKLLGTETIGIHQSFRNYGGNSLTLLKLSNALETEFSLTITLADLMKNDSIATQAIYVRERQMENNVAFQEETIII